MNEWSDNELECIDSSIIQAALSARRHYWHKEIEKLRYKFWCLKLTKKFFICSILHRKQTKCNMDYSCKKP